MKKTLKVFHDDAQDSALISVLSTLGVEYEAKYGDGWVEYSYEVPEKKELTPSFMKWSKIGLTDDGQFGCKICKGKKVFSFSFNPAKTDKCGACEGTGYMVEYLSQDVRLLENEKKKLRDDYKKLEDWVKSTSKCTLCKGDSYKTFGGCPCKECGLEGTQPWGG